MKKQTMLPVPPHLIQIGRAWRAELETQGRKLGPAGAKLAELFEALEADPFAAERAEIEAALEASGGDRAAAAMALGLAPRTLYRTMGRLQIGGLPIAGPASIDRVPSGFDPEARQTRTNRPDTPRGAR